MWINIRAFQDNDPHWHHDALGRAIMLFISLEASSEGDYQEGKGR